MQTHVSRHMLELVSWRSWVRIRIGAIILFFLSALVNFSEDCPKNILAHYLDAIIAKLEAILSSKFKELVEKGNKMVLEQIVTTLASVADTGMKKHAQM